MENSLKPQPLMAEVLPGFTVIVLLFAAYGATHRDKLYLFSDKNAATLLGTGFIALIASWIVGTFLDALRDIAEHALDKWCPLNWHYLLDESNENIQKLENSWLAHYFLTGNMCLASIAACPFIAAIIGRSHPLWIGGILLAVFVFLVDFWLLREELRRLIGYDLGRPNIGAYTRIAVSTAAPSSTCRNSQPGVGVVAIRDIPKGTLNYPRLEAEGFRSCRLEIDCRLRSARLPAHRCTPGSSRR